MYQCSMLHSGLHTGIFYGGGTHISAASRVWWHAPLENVLLYSTLDSDLILGGGGRELKQEGGNPSAPPPPPLCMQPWHYNLRSCIDLWEVFSELCEVLDLRLLAKFFSHCV